MASSMAAPTSATPGSASSSTRTRICKKLVVKGHASSSGASYTLHLKIQLPASERTESYVLIADPAVELQDAIVHRLDSSGAAPALSTSAATAASALGIPLSIDHDLNDSFIDYEPRERAKPSNSPSPKDASDVPTIAQTDNGNITLRTSVRANPRTKHSLSMHGDSNAYMVTLHLFTTPLSTPPLAPFSVKLAVPVCLNNYMRFTVDESIDSNFHLHGMAVEIDPPILPISTQRRPAPRRSLSASSHRAPSVASISDDEADLTLRGSDSVDEAELEHDDTAIAGPFHACDALVLRIASQQAADFISIDPPLRILPNALRAEKVHSSIKYQLQVSQSSALSDEALKRDAVDGTTEVNFEAILQVHNPSFPSLDREVQLYIQLDPDVSMLKWQPATVDASRGILSWSFGPLASSSPPSTQQSKRSSDSSQARSSTFEIGDLVVLPEPSQQFTDDEDLLSVAPPKGINDADFDFSLDNAAAPSTKQRRFSLQSSTSTRHIPTTPSSEPSESAFSDVNVLAVTLSLLPVLQSAEPLSLCVRGTIMLPTDLARMLRTPVPMCLQYHDPTLLARGLFVPAAQTHTYGGIDLAPVKVEQDSLLHGVQAKDPLDDSRETVQQHLQQSMTGPPLQRTDKNVTGAADTELILKKALAIIAAHNESLPTAPYGTGDRSGGRDWILRVSHVLWTLFLTAMILMLFNAGQTANQALSDKLDELSRLVEVSTGSGIETSCWTVEVKHKTPTPEVSGAATPAASSWLPVQKVPVQELVDTEDKGASTQDSDLTSAEILPHDDGLTEDHTLLDDFATSSTTGLQTSSSNTGLSFYVSTWLRDVLHMPLTILQRILSIFVGA